VHEHVNVYVGRPPNAKALTQHVIVDMYVVVGGFYQGISMDE